jgi:LPS export ABC transporter permease LptG
VSTAIVVRYFFYQTPQFVYYIIPMAVLVAALVTIGLMTKNSELIVIRACGVSLYRVAVPLMLFAMLASAALLFLEERVLVSSNPEAERLNRVIRGLPPQTLGLEDRRWLVGTDGTIYHYDLFDPHSYRFVRLTVYHVDPERWALASLTYADDVRLVRRVGPGGSSIGWKAYRGWTREFTVARRKGGSAAPVNYAPFSETDISLEPARYFKTEQPQGERMTYAQLKQYIARRRLSGFNTTAQMVDLQRKIAFPLVTIVMTLIAVPFAVTTGRRGALYGVGVGIVLALVYWMALSVFGALGSGGLITPTLAAWAPNILFGAAAAYLVLTVRT